AVVLDLIKQGRLTPETMFRVSEKAWRTGGSKMFVLVDTDISVLDLLKGIIVLSGNDACIVMAENIAGSERAFAELMNARAKTWGLEASRFVNPTGLPHPDHVMSMLDLARLARHLWLEHPSYRYLFSLPQFTWSDITQPNRNPLIGELDGALGMKTGHTEEAGYGVVGLAERGETRRIIVVSGLESEKARRNAALDLMETAFSSFVSHTFFEPGDRVGEGIVFAGKSQTVPLVIDQQVKMILHRRVIEKAAAELTYAGPLRAPVRKGTEVGLLRLTIPGDPVREFPLYTGDAVAGLSFFEKVKLGLQGLLTPPEADGGQRQ
ncbi:MAG: D-alanyl-D-alanine carboxypeptidase family protein, partial [Pseudomonadota bacterium]